jgi:hypothetical protein
MKILTMAALAVLFLTRSHAADAIKPLDLKLGLWETTTKTEMPGMPAMPTMPQLSEETLAKLPPAQRAQLEARMKAGGGAGGPRNAAVKSCITKESLARGANFAQSDNSCTSTVINSSSTKQEIHMECARGQNKMSGDATFERVDTEHVKGTIVMKSAEGAAPINMKMSFDTKWVSADCGDVKPPAFK